MNFHGTVTTQDRVFIEFNQELSFTISRYQKTNEARQLSIGEHQALGITKCHQPIRCILSVDVQSCSS